MAQDRALFDILLAKCKEENERPIQERIEAFKQGDDKQLLYLIAPEFFYTSQRLKQNQAILTAYFTKLTNLDYFSDHKREVILQGYANQHGYGGQYKLAFAFSCYMEAAKDYPIAEFLKISLYSEARDATNAAVTLASAAVEKHVAYACFELGMCYQTKPDESFRKYYHFAADNGDPRAQLCLGNVYLAEKNDVLALKFFRQAARLGVYAGLHFASFCKPHEAKEAQPALPAEILEELEQSEDYLNLSMIGGYEKKPEKAATLFRRAAQLPTCEDKKIFVLLDNLVTRCKNQPDAAAKKTYFVCRYHRAIAQDNSTEFRALAKESIDWFNELFLKEQCVDEYLPLLDEDIANEVIMAAHDLLHETCLTLPFPVIKIALSYLFPLTQEFQHLKFLHDPVVEAFTAATLPMSVRVKQLSAQNDSAFLFISIDKEFCESEQLRHKRKQELAPEMKRIIEAGESKDPVQNFLTGYAYYHGIYVEKNRITADKYFESAKESFPLALYFLHKKPNQSVHVMLPDINYPFFIYSLTADENTRRIWARQYLLTAHKKNLPCATRELAKQTACTNRKKYLMEAAKAGDIEALGFLALDAMEIGDVDRYIHYTSIVAKHDPQSFLFLGSFYSVRKDFPKAAFHFRQYRLKTTDRHSAYLHQLLENSKPRYFAGFFPLTQSHDNFCVQYHCAIGLENKTLLAKLLADNRKLFLSLLKSESPEDREFIFTLSDEAKGIFYKDTRTDDKTCNPQNKN